MGEAVFFVGRARELPRLRAVVDGDARLLLVVGDAGVGKTRFVAEGLRLAAGDGLVAVSGGCLPLANKLPLLPVADALGELGRLEQGRALEAALSMTPPYVRGEVARLLPQLGTAGEALGEPSEGWRQERLFTAVAELLGAAARQGRLALVVEDVHWADTVTLDFLTFVVRAARVGAVTVVVTCRSDEALDPQVAGWLTHVRASAAIEEVRLGPLSAAETAEQVAALVGGSIPAQLAEELYARGEGNPFFTEQLVAASQADHPAGGLGSRSALPARLGELLAARAASCGDDARAVLTALAVAGRPLTEEMVAAITTLTLTAVRGGLRELAATRLLADGRMAGGYRPRHALLAEAVASGLLPGESTVLHERIAEALLAVGDEALAAEVAGHWAIAGRPGQELRARVAAAMAAERVYGYAEAAAHWQRAIELCQPMPDGGEAQGLKLPGIYLRAIDALEIAGEMEQACMLAEDAYRRFARHPDRATAAAICRRAGHFRGLQTQFFGTRDTPDTGLPLIEEALRLFENEPVSAEQAEAWHDYAVFLHYYGSDEQARDTAMRKALEIAEAAGVPGLVTRIVGFQGFQAFTHGKVAEGFAILARGLDLAEAAGDVESRVWLAADQSNALELTGNYGAAAEAALSALKAAGDIGRQSGLHAAMLIANATSALLAQGRTAEAAALVEPLTTGPPDRDHWIVHLSRIEVDLIQGHTQAAAERRMQLNAATGQLGSGDWGRATALWAAELELWAGRPAGALEEIRRVLLPVTTWQRAIFCGPLLTAGMRACADLAEQARACLDKDAAGTARATAAELASWLAQMHDAPFRDHAYVASIPAERATWDAERTRLEGASDPGAWAAAASAWDNLGCPHRAGYAWWRHAEALLAAGQPRAAAAALQAAAARAETHALLLAEIRKLAQRAHVPLPAPSAPHTAGPPAAPRRYGLTGRELAVLRLLAAGRTNAQIGAQLYMSPKTASVHVTSILRKLGVASRVEAAAVAERAGLLHDRQP